jgi:hypothetical protein
LPAYHSECRDNRHTVQIDALGKIRGGQVNPKAFATTMIARPITGAILPGLLPRMGVRESREQLS